MLENAGCAILVFANPGMLYCDEQYAFNGRQFGTWKLWIQGRLREAETEKVRKRIAYIIKCT